MEKSVIVKNLSKNFGNICAVSNVNFDIGPGEIFALIGPNGAGKSTTLRMIATILSIGNGEIKIFDYDVKQNPGLVRQVISYLPEEAGAYKNLSGLGYLKFMAGLFSDKNNKQQEFIELAKEIAGLGRRLGDKIKTYSKGMTRKLLLARAIMTRPKLAILDEPTSGLDVLNAFEIRKIIKNFASGGMTVLLSSHNMLEIEFLSDRVGLIHQGEIFAIGTPQELKQKYNAKNLEEVFVNLVAHQ